MFEAFSGGEGRKCVFRVVKLGPLKVVFTTSLDLKQEKPGLEIKELLLVRVDWTRQRRIARVVELVTLSS